MDKMSLFFALWPDDQVRQHIVDDTEAIVIDAGGKPVQPRSYHVTLAFLGEVRQSSMDDIIRVARSVRFRRFSLQFDRIDYWSSSRILWLGPTGQPPVALNALVDNIWDKLENLGFVSEAGLYRPHITLGRDVSDGVGTNLQEPIEWPVSSFTLVHSLADQNGMSYMPLEQFAAGD
jgi:RNA 2',3'-cyclic 3'-phosphodiesterase